MNIDLIFKIAAIGILVAVLNMVLKQYQREDMAMLTTLTGIIVVLLMVIDLINRLFENIKSIFQLY